MDVSPCVGMCREKEELEQLLRAKQAECNDFNEAIDELDIEKREAVRMAVERTIADMTAECKQLLQEFTEDRERYVCSTIFIYLDETNAISMPSCARRVIHVVVQGKKGKRGTADPAGI